MYRVAELYCIQQFSQKSFWFPHTQYIHSANHTGFNIYLSSTSNFSTSRRLTCSCNWFASSPVSVRSKLL